MLVILLLHLLDLLILGKDAVGCGHIPSLHAAHLLHHIGDGLVLLLIGLRKLLAHGLVHGRRISCVLFLGLLQLVKSQVEITELQMEGIVHLLQKLIGNIPDGILLASGHRSHQHIQRIVHLLEGRGNDLFKAVCHLNGKLLCHLLHGTCLQLLACKKQVPGFILRSRHYTGVEFLKECLQFLCHGRILSFHAKGIYNGKRNTINRGKERYLNTFYQRCHRGSHGAVVCRLEITKSPYQTKEGSQNTDAGENIRHHFQKLLVDVDIQLVLIDKLLDISKTFLTVVDAVCEAVHLLIQIFIIKQFS